MIENDPNIYLTICSTSTVEVFHELLTDKIDFNNSGAEGSCCRPTGLFICIFRGICSKKNFPTIGLTIFSDYIITAV